jgi:hypothetical protein
MWSRKDKGLNTLLWELSDNEEDMMMDIQLDVPDDPQWPWICDYCAYMDVSEQVPEGWTQSSGGVWVLTSVSILWWE